MRVDVLIREPRNLEHVARHGIQKDEVDEVLERFHNIRKVWKGRYAMRGQTHSGRYLMVIRDSLGQGRAYVVTAREMTDSEKMRFRRHL